LGGTTKRTARYVCHPSTFVGSKRTGNWEIEMNMKLRFCESEIDYWTTRYTECQHEDNREREEQLIGFREKILRRGCLTKYELYTVARWKLCVYGEDAAEPTKRNPDDLIEITTRQAFTSRNDWEKLCTLTQLQGIGQSVASAILHLYDKEQYPILDIHALWSVGLKFRQRSSYPCWPKYIAFCRDIANRNSIDMRTLDRALWRYSYDNQEG